MQNSLTLSLFQRYLSLSLHLFIVVVVPGQRLRTVAGVPSRELLAVRDCFLSSFSLLSSKLVISLHNSEYGRSTTLAVINIHDISSVAIMSMKLKTGKSEHEFFFVRLTIEAALNLDPKHESTNRAARRSELYWNKYTDLIPMDRITCKDIVELIKGTFPTTVLNSVAFATDPKFYPVQDWWSGSKNRSCHWRFCFRNQALTFWLIFVVTFLVWVLVQLIKLGLKGHDDFCEWTLLAVSFFCYVLILLLGVTLWYSYFGRRFWGLFWTVTPNQCGRDGEIQLIAEKRNDGSESRRIRISAPLKHSNFGPDLGFAHQLEVALNQVRHFSVVTVVVPLTELGEPICMSRVNQDITSYSVFDTLLYQQREPDSDS